MQLPNPSRFKQDNFCMIKQVKGDNFSMTMQDNFCCHACEVLRVRDRHVSPSPFTIIIIFIFHFSIIIKPLFYFYCDASQPVALILSFQKHGLWLNQHHSLLIAALSIKFTNQSCIYMHTQPVLFLHLCTLLSYLSITYQKSLYMICLHMHLHV